MQEEQYRIVYEAVCIECEAVVDSTATAGAKVRRYIGEISRTLAER